MVVVVVVVVAPLRPIRFLNLSLPLRMDLGNISIKNISQEHYGNYSLTWTGAALAAAWACPSSSPLPPSAALSG